MSFPVTLVNTFQCTLSTLDDQDEQACSRIGGYSMLHVSTKVEQHAVVLELSGRFDFHLMEHFLSALDHAEITYLPQHVILDLSQVNFIDTMAIGRIVTTSQRLNQASIRFTLTGQHGEVDAILKEINFEAIVPTVATMADPLALPPWQHSL
jgi:anti-anti-sigma factor